MKILILCGSPHKNGTTNALTESFIKGIHQDRHVIKKIWLQDKKLSPCMGCMYCKNHGNKCVLQDDAADILKDVYEADLIVFVSPLYYFAMTSQLKIIIDRFFAVNNTLREQKKNF